MSDQPTRITWGGESLTRQEWAERTGISAAVIYMRLSRGWAVERALTVPPRRYRGKNSDEPDRTVEQRAWAKMMVRCDALPGTEDYAKYGARGITVCPEWRASFEAFFEYVGPRPGSDYSLDRIDNDRGYEPGNIRWATRQQQMRNTRRSMRLTWQGETLTIFEWAERTGITAGTIRGRIRQGWSVKRTLTTPL